MVKCSSTKTACQTQTSLKLMSGVISIWFIFANTFLFCTLPSPEPNSAEHRSRAAVLFLNTVFSSLFTDTMFRTKNVQFTLYSDSGSPKTSEGCLVLNLQTIKKRWEQQGSTWRAAVESLSGSWWRGSVKNQHLQHVITNSSFLLRRALRPVSVFAVAYVELASSFF